MTRRKNLIALDDSLDELARMDARKAKVVELRFFGGLSVRGISGSIGNFGPNRHARLE